MTRTSRRAMRRQAAKDAAFLRYADSLSEEEKLGGLVAELVSECLATGLSVADAEARLLDKGVRDLKTTSPLLYEKVAADADARGLSVVDLMTMTLADDRAPVRQRAQAELNRLRVS